MRARFLSLMLFGATVIGLPTASAQTVMDGTDRFLNETEIEKLNDGFRRLLKDPLSSQLIKLQRSGPSTICGLVNSKNGLGAYTGFEKFAVDFKSERIVIVPPDRDLPRNLDALPRGELERLRAEAEDRLTALKAILLMCPPKGA